MKKSLLLCIVCLSWITFSCRNSADIDPQDITLAVGEQKTVKIGQESLVIRLAKVTPVFSEAVVEQNGTTTFHEVYDTVLTIDQQDLTFRSYFETTDQEPITKKNWELLKESYEGILSYKSYQLGISTIYAEGNPDAGGSYFCKVLIN
jgi:hypothetical protein